MAAGFVQSFCVDLSGIIVDVVSCYSLVEIEVLHLRINPAPVKEQGSEDAGNDRLRGVEAHEDDRE